MIINVLDDKETRNRKSETKRNKEREAGRLFQALMQAQTQQPTLPQYVSVMERKGEREGEREELGIQEGLCMNPSAW